jgi:hypothetical protein
MPPYVGVLSDSASFFGIVPAPTATGLRLLRSWLKDSEDLKGSVIVVLYPACATDRDTLNTFCTMVEEAQPRLAVRVHALEHLTDRCSNVLCFVTKGGARVLVAGPTEDFATGYCAPAQINFAFQTDPSLAEEFRLYFDWLWTKSADIQSPEAQDVPRLVLPSGSEEGARLWQSYRQSLANPANEDTSEPVAGAVESTVEAEKAAHQTSATEALGVPKLDPLARELSRLYSRGLLVSIDKLSRIPPLDAPLDPRIFGDPAELHRGHVTRKVSMRVSIIDEKTLKKIEARRNGLRNLLAKFTFGLADGMRWMPESARELFELEVARTNEEGQTLISNMLAGDVEAFLEERHDTLVSDLDAMLVEIGRRGQVTREVIDKVKASLKERLTKAKSANFLPKLTYSRLTFADVDNSCASPWGQAYSLLSDIAGYPRRAITDSFFLQGLKTEESEWMQAMDVASDALHRPTAQIGLKQRCKLELDLLERIEKSTLDAKERCDLTWEIIRGHRHDKIHAALARATGNIQK